MPDIGIVPVLAPLEHQETELTVKYLRDNIDGRLASRHFRNHFHALDELIPGETFDDFCTWARPWLPELELRSPQMRFGGDGAYLDVFYAESGSRIEKELFWAGDGLQIWIQILLHLFRLRDHDVIILDEPDVFLHPDLQRRLVRLLDELPGQTITATHSPELLAEAQPETVIWVDKSRRRAVVAPDSAVLADLVAAIGSQFNIGRARALRADTVLFVEGDDMKILRHVASACGAEKIAREDGIAVVPLKGYSNWNRIEPFAWLARDLLEGSVRAFAILRSRLPLARSGGGGQTATWCRGHHRARLAAKGT